MKTLSIIFIFIGTSALAQVPTGFKYQAVVRDAAGQVKANSEAEITLGILQGSASGQPVYTESHHVTTTETGLINLTVGEGGYRTGEFQTIDWSQGPYFLQVTVDGQVFGTSQFMSVPYALYALKAGSMTTDAALAAICPNGCWDLYGNAGTTVLNYVGTRDEQPLYFRTNDTPRLRLSLKGQLEPLRTGGSVFLGEQAGENDDLIDNDNVLIGHQSGQANTVGMGNTAVGYRSLWKNVDGYSNIALGAHSLTSNTSGHYNISVGNNAMEFNTDGSLNIAIGPTALQFNETGTMNTAVGHGSMQQSRTGTGNTALGSNAMHSSDGNYNTAVGQDAMFYAGGSGNTAVGVLALWRNYANNNTAVGKQALTHNTEGEFNTAVGTRALADNTTSKFNSALGWETLSMNTTGQWNTGLGALALAWNQQGNRNTAAGYHAAFYNHRGSDNTAFGNYALNWNIEGNQNTAVGSRALENAFSGHNTAVGYSALHANNTGYRNTAVGHTALRANVGGSENTAIGESALSANVDGVYNTAVGYGALNMGTSFFNATALGYTAQVSGSNEVRIGNVYVTKIGGQVNWSAASDGRFKTSIRENVPGLDFITRLRPVTYRINHAVVAAKNNSNMTPDLNVHTGFIAQEVEAAAKAVNFDFSGVNIPANPDDWYSLSYAEFVVPLVKAVQEQQVTIHTQQQQIEALEQRLQALEGESGKRAKSRRTTASLANAR